MSMGTPEVTDLRGSSRARESVPAVVSVSWDGDHRFSKPVAPEIRLLAGLGVEGDAHAGVTAAELLDEMAALGFAVAPGQLGENVTTCGLDLPALPRGAVLRLGADARVEVTGLRNPCHQIDKFRPGLLKQVVGRAADGGLVRKAGVMGVVLFGGTVRPGDPITVDLPPLPHEPLDRV